jgi:CRISPR/Cas system CMR-associated protein Cmr5 small subunit
MKTCSVIAGILTFIATLITSITPIFAQSNLNDTLKLTKSKRIHQKFDFESVAKRLTGLSKPVITIPQKDSLSKRIQTKVIQDLHNTHGHIDLGYAYGLNTVFVDTSRSIGSIFKTSGDFSSAIIGLPVNISFNYSTLRVPLGTNNYFRISLDKNRLIEQQKQKVTASIANIEEQQVSLTKKQAELTGLLGYVEVYLDQLKRLAEHEAENRIKTNTGKLTDTLTSSKSLLSDSIAGIKEKNQNKVNFKKLDLNDSLDYKLYRDSILKIYNRINELKNGLDSISTKLSTSKEMLTSYQSQLNAPDLKSPNLNGSSISKTSLLQSIQTFDLGLTYPKTTAMSGQNVPIKGVHAEIQLRKYYLSVASGLTLNNLMLSTNEIQNKLNYNQNVFNNFDFQQIMNNGWLTTIKTGYGTLDGTHAFVGFNYLTNTRFLNPAGTLTQTDYDPAASFELDFRYVATFLKGSAFDLVYGKTSLNKRLDTVTDMGVFQSVFSGYHSNLLLAKYSQSLPKFRTDFSVSYRRIDPYVNTTQFGMMQPNNQRIEFKTNHRVAKFMKLGLLYKLEETLKALSGSNDLRLSVAGVNFSGNYTSLLNYSFFVNHIHHRMRLPQLTEVQKGNNYLVGSTLASSYELGNAKASTSIAYNDYLISDTTSLNKYTQFGLIQSLSDKRYLVSLSYDYFYRSIDGLTTGTNVFGLSGNYKFKKLKIGAGLKLASDFLNANSMGGHFEVQWAAYKFLDVSIRAERFVLGDFYRNYYRTQYENFPYLMTLQTRFKI